jgi:DNA-binding NtrC family response regulator
MEAPVPDRVLVVDDEPSIRFSIAERLRDDGYEVRTAEDGARGLFEFGKGVDAVVLDYRLPDCTGLDVLRGMRASTPSVPVIMLTGYSDVDQAVLAMKEGAYHYGRKPCDLDQLAGLVALALENSRLRRHIRALQTQGGDGPTLIGESPSMQRVRALVQKIAASPSTTVLVTGESGTGKDVVARLLHASSARAAGPFTNITCSALPENLLESELFGHEKGAFTDAKARKQGLIELSQGGTLFLDEIGEMSPGLQSKLLRFLEEKQFRRVGGTEDLRADVRIIAATNRELKKEIARGGFREDLYYRLAVLEIALPPLRDRSDDVRLLVEYFADRFGREFHKPVQGIHASAWRLLSGYGWPGNVRELRNAVERAVLLSDGPTLEEDDFLMLDGATSLRRSFELPPEGVDIEKVERELLTQALERVNGNRTRAGELLGLNRDQVRYRIAKFGLDDDRDG